MFMAKAAEKRKKSRVKYLTGLSATNPEKFLAEWDMRIDSLF